MIMTNIFSNLFFIMRIFLEFIRVSASQIKLLGLIVEQFLSYFASFLRNISN